MPSQIYFVLLRRRKPFDSPAAPERVADYKLLTDFDDLV
jgi:hypothetical protein